MSDLSIERLDELNESLYSWPDVSTIGASVLVSRQMLGDVAVPRQPMLYLRDLIPSFSIDFKPPVYVQLDYLLPPNPWIEREERQRPQQQRHSRWVAQHCLCRYEADYACGEYDGDVRVDNEACPVHGRNPDPQEDEDPA